MLTRTPLSAGTVFALVQFLESEGYMLVKQDLAQRKLVFRFRGDVVIYGVSQVVWNQTKKSIAMLELRAEKVTQKSSSRDYVYKLDEFANEFPNKAELSEELYWEDAFEEDTTAQKLIQYSIE